MHQWSVKQPRGQLTIQADDLVVIEARGHELELLANVPQLDHEKLEYSGYAQGLMIAVSRYQGDPDSRRAAVSFLEKDQVTPSCISMLHLLGDELRATMRSSSVTKLPSDLSFLAATAMAFGCHYLAVMINSLHLVLEEARDD